MSETAYLALGSNLGDRDAQLANARTAIGRLGTMRITAASTIEETAPLGGLAQGAYLNQMLRAETSLDPEALLAALHAIERAAGRDRDVAARWASRTIDIDVVLYGEETLRTPALVIPHPGLASRDFWQRELAELGVDWRAALDAVAARVRETHPAGVSA